MSERLQIPVPLPIKKAKISDSLFSRRIFKPRDGEQVTVRLVGNTDFLADKIVRTHWTPTHTVSGRVSGVGNIEQKPRNP